MAFNFTDLADRWLGDGIPEPMRRQFAEALEMANPATLAMTPEGMVAETSCPIPREYVALYFGSDASGGYRRLFFAGNLPREAEDLTLCADILRDHPDIGAAVLACGRRGTTMGP
jgi:hypothetical protein